MTKEDDLEKLKGYKIKFGENSSEYLEAHNEFTNKHGNPGRDLTPPGKPTNGGSHGGDSNFYGSEKREK